MRIHHFAIWCDDIEPRYTGNGYYETVICDPEGN